MNASTTLPLGSVRQRLAQIITTKLDSFSNAIRISLTKTCKNYVSCSCVLGSTKNGDCPDSNGTADSNAVSYGSINL